MPASGYLPDSIAYPRLNVNNNSGGRISFDPIPPNGYIAVVDALSIVPIMDLQGAEGRWELEVVTNHYAVFSCVLLSTGPVWSPSPCPIYLGEGIGLSSNVINGSFDMTAWMRYVPDPNNMPVI